MKLLFVWRTIKSPRHTVSNYIAAKEVYDTWRKLSGSISIHHNGNCLAALKAHNRHAAIFGVKVLGIFFLCTITWTINDMAGNNLPLWWHCFAQASTVIFSLEMFIPQNVSFLKKLICFYVSLMWHFNIDRFVGAQGFLGTIYTDLYLSSSTSTPPFLVWPSLFHALLKNTCLNFTSSWMQRCESANVFRWHSEELLAPDIVSCTDIPFWLLDVSVDIELGFHTSR